MRFHVVFLLVAVLAVGSSQGFFVKKAATTLLDAKLNLVKDAKAVFADLKESAVLKAKAVTGGIKAIGKAKLGFAKGIKHAKLGLLKGIAGAKLAKLSAIKAGKIAFAKTLVAAKLAPVDAANGAHAHVIESVMSGLPVGPGIVQALKNHVSDSTSHSKLSLGGLLTKFGSSGSDSVVDGNLALFPHPGRINIVTYKSEAQASAQASASADHATSYGTAIRGVPPSTSYGVPILGNL